MRNLEQNKVILWDFDGVIMDSMAVRDKGFELVLQSYPSDQVSLLMEYHRKNGGLSRYHKFRHFFEQIRKESVADAQIQTLADSFSKLMLENLLNPSLLIIESLNFIKENHDKYSMHIVSGSDQRELRGICKTLGISDYFISINGSPTAKKKLVNDLLRVYDYPKENCCLIGDSFNDYEAAKTNNIRFYGYNNIELIECSDEYLFDYNIFEKNMP